MSLPELNTPDALIGDLLLRKQEVIDEAIGEIGKRFYDTRERSMGIVIANGPEDLPMITVTDVGKFGLDSIGTYQQLWAAEAEEYTIELNGALYDVRKGMTAAVFKAMWSQCNSVREAAKPTLLSGEATNDGFPLVGFTGKVDNFVKISMTSMLTNGRFMCFRPAISLELQDK